MNNHELPTDSPICSHTRCENERLLSNATLLMSYNFYERSDTQINRNLHAAARYNTATAIAATWMSATMLATLRMLNINIAFIPKALSQNSCYLQNTNSKKI